MKLHTQDIEELSIDFFNGVEVKKLSKKYKVTQGTIYYHLKNKHSDNKNKNSCYMARLKKQIFILEHRIKTGYFTEQQLPYARNELGRMQYWLKVDRSCLPSEPFVLQ